MFNRMKSKWKLNRTNDQGSAIVVVILAIAFVGMLVAMMAYMSYMNYIMKATDRGAKDNFYSAETALDEINVGLQSEISYAMTNAYTDVMKLAAKETDDKRRELYRQAFSDQLIEKLEVKADGSISEALNADPSGYATRFENHLKSYWQETPIKGVTDDGTGNPITYGAELILTDKGHDDTCRFIYNTDKQTITLKGIKITYTDEKGFVSIIETDIVMSVPDLDFAASAELPDLLDYTLIASTHTEPAADDNRTKDLPTTLKDYFKDYQLYESVVSDKGAKTKISGKVYGGRKGIYAANNSEIDFETNDAYATKGSEVTAASLNTKNNGTIKAGSEKTITNTTESKQSPVINVENINLDAGTVDLYGVINVRDDLNLDGRAGAKDKNGNLQGSTAILGGSYFGYGDLSTKSQNSSSILLNGAQCTLDMSNIEKFLLRGHAYIGAKHYNPRTNGTSDYLETPEDVENYIDEVADYSLDDNNRYVIPNNEEDVVLGQSLATKSDQLLYMVPAECMVYDTYDPDTDVPDHVAKGSKKKQVLAKNPLTYAEYLKYAAERVTAFNADGSVQKDSSGHDVKRYRYEMVNLDRSFNNMEIDIATAYGASAVPVVRKVSGNWLVYYYMTFDTPSHANQYFADFFAANPEALNRYANEYIKDIKYSAKMKQALADKDATKFAIAGNMIDVSVVDGKRVYSLIKDTSDVELSQVVGDHSAAIEIEQQAQSVLGRYLGITHYLLYDINKAPANAEKYTVRDNLIEDDDTLHNIAGAKKGTYYFTKKVPGSSGDDYIVAALVLNDENPVKLSDIKYSAGGKIYYPSFVFATGDLVLDRDNKGLIWCRNADVAVGCSKLEENPAGVLAVLTTKYNDHSFYEVLVNGISYVDITGVTAGSEEEAALEAAREKDYIVISDLIQYDNWKKE